PAYWAFWRVSFSSCSADRAGETRVRFAQNRKKHSRTCTHDQPVSICRLDDFRCQTPLRLPYLLRANCACCKPHCSCCCRCHCTLRTRYSGLTTNPGGSSSIPSSVSVSTLAILPTAFAIRKDSMTA